MSLGNLTGTLAREFRRSPAKTGFLIALCPVALYFLVPLFLGGKSRNTKAPKRAQVAAAVPVPEVAAPSPASTHSWEDLQRWMHMDRYMLPAALPAATRNPFQWGEDHAELADSEEEPEEAEVLGRDLDVSERFGLVLSGTMVSRGVRLATINGRTYRENDTVNVSDQDGARGPALEYEFLVRKVDPDHVVLVHNDLEYQLALKKRRPTGITILHK